MKLSNLLRTIRRFSHFFKSLMIRFDPTELELRAYFALEIRNESSKILKNDKKPKKFDSIGPILRIEVSRNVALNSGVLLY